MPHRLLASLPLFAMLSALSSGCAVVAHGFHQSVTIASVPAGATVTIDGVEAGRTPLTVSLSRVRTHRVELRKPGFVPAAKTLQASMDEYMNHFIRFGIDIDSGAANELVPATLDLELKPEEIATATTGDAFEQMTAAVLAADDLWHRGSVSQAEHHAMIEKILTRFAR